MVDHSKDQGAPADGGPPGEDAPARPFFHRDLLDAARPETLIRGRALQNILHHIHFMDSELLVLADDRDHGESFLLRARLEACLPGRICCAWAEASSPPPEGALLRHIVVSDGLSLIFFPIQVTEPSGEGFSASLPEEAHLLGKRCVRRYPARDVQALLSQNAFLARGELVDITPLAFRIRLAPDSGHSFIRLNGDGACTITLQRGERTLFSGPCRIVRQAGDLHRREVVLAPLVQTIQRFQKKKIRNPRLGITPPPIAHFAHPFNGKALQRDIHNLSFSGFAVAEQAEDSVLLPGMVIPGLEIRYAGLLKLTCDCQVIYRRAAGRGRVLCGVAILDMDFRSYRHLSHIMVQAADPQARFASELDTEALWEFFFSTGFIYPKKYHLIQSSREQFKRTYDRLYDEDQEIEAHFTYAENGRIFGHVSIFRAYQRAWMVHHLAARPLAGKRTGLSVLKNVLRFFDGLYRYPSVGMDHMLFYFRPENHFPNLFFGGFARNLANPRACSLDLFAYLTEPTGDAASPLPAGWALHPFREAHLPDLERFYRRASGGLLLDALRLGQRTDHEESLEAVYRRHGLRRSWQTHALTREGALKAVILENHSEPGLNLSELLNGLKVIVTDPAGLPWGVLRAAVAQRRDAYDLEAVPVMLYPATYPAEQGHPADKHYLLWILNTQYGKDYLDYMEQKTRLTPRFLLKYLLRKLVPR